MKEIVIKIDDTIYNRIVNMNEFLYYGTFGYLLKAIKNGTELLKGHGRLIDADMLLQYGACPNDCNGTTTCVESYEHFHCPIRVFDIESINDTPTIIEADKEEE